jgi:uncharacterized membrane protein HdeD (DUF308 family)
MAGSDTSMEPVMAEVKLFPWWLLLIWGLLTIIIGLMFLVTPGVTTVLLITFMGAYWLVGGIFALGSLVVDRTHIGMKILLSIINIIAGIFILLYPFYSTVFVLSFFVILIGFWACLIGAVHLYQGFTAKDAGNAVLGIISLVFGILLLVNPFVVAALLPFIAGGFGIVSGLATIYIAFVTKKEPAAMAS